MRLFRVLLSMVLAVAALSLFTASASAQSRLPCQPFPGCFFGGGQEDDDDDDDGNGSSSAPIGDFTFGAGSAAFPPASSLSTFRFAAASGPSGENASGFADATSVFGERFVGPVTCLRVDGRRATFEVDNTAPAGRDAVFFVGDFGPAGVGDEFNFDPIPQADATCPEPGPREQSVIAGDIVVGDNEPLGGGDDDDDDDDGADDDD
jgi:hypothetical protein